MKRKKIVNLIIAGFGLAVAAVLLFSAIRFYRTIKALTSDNPAINPPHDTLTTASETDSFIESNASLNRQIAEQLGSTRDAGRINKQMLLHRTTTNFIHNTDSIQSLGITSKQLITDFKTEVNKTNLAYRASLFEIKDLEDIPELESFMILDENKMENTIFECLKGDKAGKQCFDQIKHQALLIENKILEKNFYRIKNE